jgi:5,10-methylene-tetrahydrofolate dehydrogenase/methenyl tetrahydrofolate cyclohydrolase
MKETPKMAGNSMRNNKMIDGNSIAAEIRSTIMHRVVSLKSDMKQTPGLAVILVGERKDSQTYVRMKKKACTECGIISFGFDYPDKVHQDVLLSKIDLLNKDPSVHGILVQLPLPKHIDENTILNAIHPDKDVDGLHPLNASKLYSTGTHVGIKKVDWSNLDTIPFPIPCTPQGCIELLDRINVPLRGKNAVVIGRSNLVGLPIAMLLLHRDASVTVVHSKTVNPKSIVSMADVVVVAVGRPEIVTSDWIKEGAIVIDVGINSIDDLHAKRGYRLVGDVDYLGCEEVAGKITPVPGGVGPMTIAMLLRNTVNSCMRMINKTSNQDI